MLARKNGQVRYFKGMGLGACKRTHVINALDDLERVEQDAVKALEEYDFVEVGSYSDWREAKTPDEVSNAIRIVLGR